MKQADKRLVYLTMDHVKLPPGFTKDQAFLFNTLKHTQ